jgi:GDP-L-fucose synthase
MNTDELGRPGHELSQIERDAKIYVAGHTGLVGSAILRRLRADGFTNLITRSHAELDLTRQADVEAFFSKEQPEIVFLAAAKVGGILANNTYKAEFIYENIMIATNVIHSAYKYGVKKLLNLGSSCIYPKHAPQPMKENSLLTGSLEPTNEPYAIAKIIAIKLCRYYNERYGTNFISLMPTNLYGPNDNFDLETSHALPALIRKFHLAKLLFQDDYKGIWRDLECFGNIPNRSANVDHRLQITDHLSRFGITKDFLTIWGTGEPCREFLHVDDLADACMFLMENYDAEDIGEFVNIGIGKDLKIIELAKLVRQVVDFKGKMELDTSKPNGMKRKLLDITKLRNLGWSPSISLDDGIKRTYDWYLKQL